MEKQYVFLLILSTVLLIYIIYHVVRKRLRGILITKFRKEHVTPLRTYLANYDGNYPLLKAMHKDTMDSYQALGLGDGPIHADLLYISGQIKGLELQYKVSRMQHTKASAKPNTKKRP